MIRLFLSLVSLPLFVLGQKQPQPVPNISAPALPVQSDSRLSLNVVVNDNSGRPVGGLQEQDFKILDNKREQKILSFEAVDQRSHGPATEVVLVDDSVNTGFDRVAYGRQQIDRFLKQDNGKLGWPVAIDFLTDYGLNIQEASSRDGNAQAAYVDKQVNSLRTIRRSAGFYGAVDRATLSLKALSQLAEYEDRRPGRKIVIWLSPGWPLLSGPFVQLSSKDQQQIFNTVVAVSTQLRAANITLYAVDPSGTADSGSLRTFYYQEFLKPVKAPNEAQFGNMALQVFATQSGGRVLFGSNDIAQEIETCVRDANAYYLLSYQAPNADGPNEYHAIEVKVDRPHMKVQTRNGYYAQAAPAGK